MSSSAFVFRSFCLRAPGAAGSGFGSVSAVRLPGTPTDYVAAFNSVSVCAEFFFSFQNTLWTEVLLRLFDLSTVYNALEKVYILEQSENAISLIFP